MAAPIDFYFDFYSPYGYLASLRIDAIAARHGREVTWRPFLIGPTLKVTGGKPLLEVPLLGAYAERDFHRSARLQGVPCMFPPGFPKKAALAASRAYYWLLDQDPAVAKRFAQAVYQAGFGEGKDISDPELIDTIAVRLGVDGAALHDALHSDACKDRLRREVEDAMARGVFGSPYVIVDGEPFWGNDRLDQVERWLATGGW